MAASAGDFLDALLGTPRKTGWMRAEAAGDRGPWRQQALLGAVAGMPTPCAMSCATMLLSIWLLTMPFAYR